MHGQCSRREYRGGERHWNGGEGRDENVEGSQAFQCCLNGHLSNWL